MNGEAKVFDLAKLINPHPKQREFLRAFSRYKFPFYGGAAGGGKSYILRWALLDLLLRIGLVWKVPHVKVGLFCEDYPSLIDRQISRIETEFPKELGEIKKSQSEGLTFKLRPEFGGGMLLPRNLDDPSKYNSTEFAAILVDELTRNKIAVFDELRKRLRWPGLPKDFNFPFGGGANPGGIGHGWVKQYWIDRSYPPELQCVANQFVFIKALSQDNPYNPESYHRDLLTLPETLRRAYAEGDWSVFAGQFFTEFRIDKHVCEPFSVPSFWTKWTATDWGNPSPACSLWFTRSPQGRTYVYRESYLNREGDKYQTKDQGREWARLASGEQYIYQNLDPNCFETSRGMSIADEYSEVGWSCRKAENDRKSGWSRVRGALRWWDAASKVEIEPELQIFSTCKNLIRTIPDQVFDEIKVDDLDSDAEDHAVDALRYGLMPPRRETVTPEEHLPLDEQDALNRIRHSESLQ